MLQYRQDNPQASLETDLCKIQLKQRNLCVLGFSIVISSSSHLGYAKALTSLNTKYKIPRGFFRYKPMVYARPLGLCIEPTSGPVTHHSYHTFFLLVHLQKCTSSNSPTRTGTGSCATAIRSYEKQDPMINDPLVFQLDPNWRLCSLLILQ